MQGAFVILGILALLIVGGLVIGVQGPAPREPVFVSTSTIPAAQGGQPRQLAAPSAPAAQPPSDPPPTDIPPGFTASQISTHWRKVRVGNPYRYGTGIDAYRHMTLSSLVPQGETLSLGGWKLKGGGGEATIPAAIATYSPTGSGEERPIALGAGDTVFIYSSRSPLAKGFRMNKCMGYLEKVYQFKPALPLACPAPYRDRSEVAKFPLKCQDHILSLQACGLPSIQTDDSACASFLAKINYGGCFEKYRGDADFFSKEWRVFLGDQSGERDIASPARGFLELYDAEGKLVDQYVY